MRAGLECGRPQDGGRPNVRGKPRAVSSVDAHGDGPSGPHLGPENADKMKAERQDKPSEFTLDLGSMAGSDTEEIDIPSTPRLKSKFYEELRQKYPRAFKRRGSLISDTSSGTDIPPYQPKNNCIRPQNGDVTFQRQSSVDTSCGTGSPGSSLAKSGSIDAALNEGLSRTSKLKQAGVPLVVDSITKTKSDGKPLSGNSSHRRVSPLSVTGQLNGKVPVKERLRRNSETLKKLLLDNPFSGKPRQFALTTQSDDEGSRTVAENRDRWNLRKTRGMIEPPPSWSGEDEMYANCAVEEGMAAESQIQAYTKKAQAGSPSSEDSDYANVSIHSLDDETLDNCKSTSSHKLDKYIVTNTKAERQTKQNKSTRQRSRRFPSPESQNDSAIETGSIPSSPSSNPHVRLKLRDTVYSGPNDQERLGTPATPAGLRTPKLGRSRPQQIYENISEGSSLNDSINSKDSDQDSGISQPTGERLRQDSASSGDTEQDNENVHRSHTLHGDGFRGNGRKKKNHASSSRTRPLRANHNIHTQPPAAQSSSCDAEVEEWMQNGLAANLTPADCRATSAAELNTRRDSPAARVHFQDELYQNIPFNGRSVSQPTLSHQVYPDPPLSSTDSEASNKCFNERPRHHYSKGAPQSNLRHTQSELVLCQKGLIRCNPADFPNKDPGLPPTDESAISSRCPLQRRKNDPVVSDIEDSIRQHNSRSSTPCDVIYAACEGDDQDLDIDTFQASPAIVLPPRVAHLNSDANSSISELETAHAFGCNSKLFEDIHSLKVKTSKKPWKKKKGHYMPEEEMEKENVEISCDKSGSTASLSSVNSVTVKAPAKNVTPNKPPKAPRPVDSKPPKAPQVRTSNYQEIKPSKTSPSTGLVKENSRRHSSPVVASENVYEDVRVYNKPSPEKSSTMSDTRDMNDCDVYSLVNKTLRSRSLEPHNDYISDFDDDIIEVMAPPLPYRSYIGDRYTDLSGSRSSLFNRMDGLRDSAKKKWKQLRRAVSMERLPTDKSTAQSESPSPMKRSPSIKSLAERLSFRKKGRRERESQYRMAEDLPPKPQKAARPSSAPLSGRRMRPSVSMTSLDTVEKPNNFRAIGKLRQLNPDGTQLVELHKPPNGPYGFFIARGNAKFNHGVFVSRLSDGLPGHFFAGLLGIGDEILEINGIPLKSMTLDTIYDMMAERNKITMKTLPYLGRTESSK